MKAPSPPLIAVWQIIDNYFLGSILHKKCLLGLLKATMSAWRDSFCPLVIGMGTVRGWMKQQKLQLSKMSKSRSKEDRTNFDCTMVAGIIVTGWPLSVIKSVTAVRSKVYSSRGRRTCRQWGSTKATGEREYWISDRQQGSSVHYGPQQSRPMAA